MSPKERKNKPGSGPIVEPSTIDKDQLDSDAMRVIWRLDRHGHQAYMVGGCVRDLMIGRRPKDFDLATSAHPRQIKRLFYNGRIIGRRFRLVHISYGKNIIETATFRREPSSSGAAGEDLLITEDNAYGSAEEDARRRDFTVNALFLDPLRNEIIDYVGGLKDLEQRILRTIGDPEVRLAEDPVRILRAIKFSARLALRIEEKTWSAMERVAPDLSRSAAPRVLEEILRLLRSGTALGAFRMLRRCGALAVILPEMDDYLEDADEDQIERFWRLLEALDSEVHGGEDPTNAVLVAVLYNGIVEQELERLDELEERVDPQASIEDLMEPFAARTRISRRDCGRARRILFQQRRFNRPQGKRFRPLLFARGEDFPEALQLFKMRTEAWGQGWDVYQGWVERRRASHQAGDTEIEAERKRARRGKKKRRTRRPRRE